MDVIKLAFLLGALLCTGKMYWSCVSDDYEGVDVKYVNYTPIKMFCLKGQIWIHLTQDLFKTGLNILLSFTFL